MNGTQFSNPRTAKGRTLRCPECGAYIHPPDTKCEAELTARKGKQCCERDHNFDGNCDRHPTI